jgi:hypothetical protein
LIKPVGQVSAIEFCILLQLGACPVSLMTLRAFGIAETMALLFASEPCAPLLIKEPRPAITEISCDSFTPISSSFIDSLVNRN